VTAAAAQMALVSCDDVLRPPVRDPDLAPLQRALEAAGAGVSILSWTSAQDWSRFDAAVLRSTWDYTQQLERFLDWAYSTALVTRLRNPFELVRWNTDKHYLLDLERGGVPVIPTAFVDRGDDVLEALSAFPRAPEMVIKPVVGAGSRGVLRFDAAGRWGAAAHVAAIHASGRGAMVQPYLGHVDAHGETALIYCGGEFSHAVRKGPTLRPPGAPGEDPFGAHDAHDAHDVATRSAEDDERAVAEAAMTVVSGLADAAGDMTTPPYARVDVVRDDDGRARVLEVELVEPSLFLDTAPGAAERCAAALLDSLGG